MEHPLTFAAFHEVPQARFGVLAAGASQLAFRTPYLDNDLVRLAYRLPESSRGSAVPARHLIRSNRNGLIDIPTDKGPLRGRRTPLAAFRRAFCYCTFKLDYLYNEGLPDSMSRLDRLFQIGARLGVIGLHKHLHYRAWFRRELSTYVSDIFASQRVQKAPFWNRKTLATLCQRHISGQGNYVQEINSVLTVEAIERLLFLICPHILKPDRNGIKRPPWRSHLRSRLCSSLQISWSFTCRRQAAHLSNKFCVSFSVRARRGAKSTVCELVTASESRFTDIGTMSNAINMRCAMTFRHHSEGKQFFPASVTRLACMSPNTPSDGGRNTRKNGFMTSTRSKRFTLIGAIWF